MGRRKIKPENDLFGNGLVEYKYYPKLRIELRIGKIDIKVYKPYSCDVPRKDGYVYCGAKILMSIRGTQDVSSTLLQLIDVSIKKAIQILNSEGLNLINNETLNNDAVILKKQLYKVSNITGIQVDNCCYEDTHRMNVITNKNNEKLLFLGYGNLEFRVYSYNYRDWINKYLKDTKGYIYININKDCDVKLANKKLHFDPDIYIDNDYNCESVFVFSKDIIPAKNIENIFNINGIFKEQSLNIVCKHDCGLPYFYGCSKIDNNMTFFT